MIKSMTFPKLTNEIATTNAVSLNIDEYETEYDEIIKVYADWLNEIVQVCVKDRSTPKSS